MSTIESAYRTLFPILRRKCERILGGSGEAEEVAQEALLRLWREQRSNGPLPMQVAWAHTTATRLAIDHLRRRKGPPLDVTLTVLGGGEARVSLRELLEQFPENQLAAVLLHRVDGLPQDVVAETLGCSPRTVRRWIQQFNQARE